MMNFDMIPANASPMAMMTADGSFSGPGGMGPTPYNGGFDSGFMALQQNDPFMAPVQVQSAAPCATCPGGVMPQETMLMDPNTSVAMTPDGLPQPQRRRRRRRKRVNPIDKVRHIKGFEPLMAQLGAPDVTDVKFGGIAIWARSTLKERSYSFLKRVEIIDEAVEVSTPVRHTSNIYIWVSMKPTNEQLLKILNLSKNFYYDQKKQLMIIRSSSLDTAVAQAAVLLMYVHGKFTYYKVVNHELLKVFFKKVRERRCRRAMYTIVNTLR